MTKSSICGTRTLRPSIVASSAWASAMENGPFAGPVEATVRIRSRHPGVAARVRPRTAGGVEVDFAEPQRGVAPGQAAVFYAGRRVLGGCWITGPLGSS